MYSMAKQSKKKGAADAATRFITTAVIPFVLFGLFAYYVSEATELIPFNSYLVAAAVGTAGAFIRYIGKDKRKYRTGEEYGSASWGQPADIKPFVDKKLENNIILTVTESLTMNPRPQNPKHGRNKNVLVIGGSGSGKTRFFVKPNIMQMHSSYVITDPSGELLHSCGKMLKDNGYIIKVFNLRNFRESMRYNPLLCYKGA